MKFLRLILVFLCAGIVFSSCQKELSQEGGTARGTLKSETTGDCLPVLINGSYEKDTLLKAANFVEIQAEITITGAYEIKTDTVNGYSFSANGVAAATGLQTIRLIGSGRPIVPGVDVFTVSFDTSSCEFNVVVSGIGGGGGGGGTVAEFTLGGTPGTCTGATLSGTYMAGLATSGTNTATINVNVTTIGTYAISTGAAVNGVVFTGAGTFTSLGANTIVLTASGTPTSAVTSVYPLAAGTSSCSFSVTYTAAGAAANYTLTCASAVVNGTYQAGAAVTAANTITLNVAVTGAGTYSITTPVVNGISFSGSGTLTATPASQPVTLTAMGTPTAAGTNAFVLTGNASTCSVNVTTTAAPVVTDFIIATVNGVQKTFNFDISGTLTTDPSGTLLEIDGYEAATGDEEFYTAVAVLGPTIAPGSYNVNATTYGVQGDYVTPAAVIYEAVTGSTNPTPAYTLTITSITATRATGTFTGAVKNPAGAVIQITNGSFSVPL